MNTIDTRIEQINDKYRVFFKMLDNSFCKDFDSMEDASNFQEEFYLNICLFLMYGTDDKKTLENYSRKTYEGANKELYTYEEYKESNIGFLFSRKIDINYNVMVESEGKQYKKVEDIRDIHFLRNNTINYKYLRLDKIRNVLRKILLLKGKKQGGFNLTNLYWDSEISAKICMYLFSELTNGYSKQDEEAIKTYTSNGYGFYNNLLYGYTININELTKENIDLFFRLLNCFRPTPYNLYLYRGAKDDKKYIEKDDEFVYNQFISTSLSAPSVVPFAYEQYQMIIPKGTRVIFVGPALDRENSIENEVILLPSKYTVEKENGPVSVLKYQESIDPAQLLLDNLKNNRNVYIDEIGEVEYERIYNYAYKKTLEMKKQELKDVQLTEARKMPSIIDDISLLLHYYGVNNQKEDHNIDSYRL